MKKLLIVIAITVAAVACERDSDTISGGRISFGFDNSKVSSGGRNSGETVPSFVLLSIETSAGAAVEIDKKIELFQFGNGYVSEDIELPVGKFKLTKFIILNSDNKAIFAAPVSNSALANLVNNPLPLEFSISASEITQVIPEVLPVNQDNTPNLFGYAEFGFKVKTPRLAKAIFVDGNSFNRREYSYNELGLVTSIVESYCYPTLNDCSQILKETLEYDADKRIIKHSLLNNGELVMRQFLYQNSRLWKILDDQGYNWDKEVEFFYEGSNIRPSYSITKGPASPFMGWTDTYEYISLSNSLKITTVRNGQSKPSQTALFKFDNAKSPTPITHTLFWSDWYYPAAPAQNVTFAYITYFKSDGSIDGFDSYSSQVEYTTFGLPIKEKLENSGSYLGGLLDASEVLYEYQ
jgi:hypothetical protein